MMAFISPLQTCTYKRDTLVMQYTSFTSPRYEYLTMPNLTTTCHLKMPLGTVVVEASAREQVHHDHDLLTERMPKHVAMLPDGNRRWARSRMLPVEAGYESFAKCTKQLALNCSNLGIQVLTVFPFSTENWNRPKKEVDILMVAFEEMRRTDFQELASHGIQVSVIGERSRLPSSLQSAISMMENLTKENKGMRFLVALNYGGRYDIIQSCKKIAAKVKKGFLEVEDVNDDIFQENLLTSDVEYEYPNIDLVIRAGGECRLSNFMLWQLAYSELYFSDKLFPDFDEADLLHAIKSFQQRDRRYGGKTYDSGPYI